MRLGLLVWVLIVLPCVALAAKSCHHSTERVQCGVLACIDGFCAPCVTDSDCYEESMFCDIAHGEGQCRLRSWVNNLNTSALLAILLSIVASCIGIVAGVGGGGILVPMYASLMTLPVSIAVGVSQLTIVGQSAFSFIFIVHSRHEDDPTRALINYQYLSLLMPMAIAGTSIGVQLGKVLPDILRIVLLMLTFVALLRRLVTKAVGQFNAMRGTRATAGPAPQLVAVSPPKQEAEITVISPSDPVGANNSSGYDSAEEAREDTKTIRSPTPLIAAPVYPIAPPREVAIIVASILVLLAGTVLRGWTSCGSPEYVALVAVPLFVLAGIFNYSYRRLQAMGAGDESSLHFTWSTETAVIFPIVAIGAGAAASMLGIGGGLILGFLFFEAGLAPLEASATSAVATLLVSGESIIQLSLQGSVHADYALAFFSVGAFSGFFGQRIIMATIKRRGWQYLIIAALTLIVALSMISLVSLAVYQAAVGFKEGGGSLLAWGRFCGR